MFSALILAAKVPLVGQYCQYMAEFLRCWAQELAPVLRRLWQPCKQGVKPNLLHSLRMPHSSGRTPVIGL